MKKLLSITILIAFAAVMVTSCITTNIDTEGDKSNHGTMIHGFIHTRHLRAHIREH
jgi:hypothetical protein